MTIGIRFANADENVINTIITDTVRSSKACTVIEYGLRDSERVAIHDGGTATISISDLSHQRVLPSMVLNIQYSAKGIKLGCVICCI